MVFHDAAMPVALPPWAGMAVCPRQAPRHHPTEWKSALGKGERERWGAAVLLCYGKGCVLSHVGRSPPCPMANQTQREG